MSEKTQTRIGTCPTHGTVRGHRRMPQPGFPYVVYAIRRQIAAKRPYRCPDCSTPVATG